MDWLAKIFFPNSSYDMRRKEMNTFLLVAIVTVALCTAVAVIIYKVNARHH